jgi:hypothetical protein
MKYTVPAVLYDKVCTNEKSGALKSRVGKDEFENIILTKFPVTS